MVTFDENGRLRPEKEIQEENDNRIRLLHYKNLRDNYEKNVVEPILGKDYYNMGCDFYSCDQMTCEDIKFTWKEKVKSARIRLACLICSLVFNVILLSIIFNH